MTSLRKRLDNILNEISIISQEIYLSGQSPPCCIVFHKNGLISCEVLGPLPKEHFLTECSKCKARIKRLVDRINGEKRGDDFPQVSSRRLFPALCVLFDWSSGHQICFNDSRDWVYLVVHKFNGLFMVVGVEPDAHVPVSEAVHSVVQSYTVPRVVWQCFQSACRISRLGWIDLQQAEILCQGFFPPLTTKVEDQQI